MPSTDLSSHGLSKQTHQAALQDRSPLAGTRLEHGLGQHSGTSQKQMGVCSLSHHSCEPGCEACPACFWFTRLDLVKRLYLEEYS